MYNRYKHFTIDKTDNFVKHISYEILVTNYLHRYGSILGM